MVAVDIPELPYLINDADNHFNEPADMYVRYIDTKFRDKAIRHEYDDRGRRIEFTGAKPSKNSAAFVRDDEFVSVASRLANEVGDENQQRPGDGQKRAPGASLTRLNPYKSLSDADKLALLEEFRRQEEGFDNRDLRLEIMEGQGISAAVMFPAAVLNIEFEYADDVDGIYANTRAYNRFVDEEIGWAYQNRMFLPAYISLADVELAVAELDRVLAQGCRLIEINAGHAHGGRANPLGGRSVADPIYDPFWARVDESGTRVCTHLGGTDYAKYGADWSEDPEAVLGNFDALQWVLYWGDRPAMETVAGMVLHNLFGRFPNVQVLIAEQGTVWLPYIVRKMDHAHAMGRRAKWGRLDRRPKEIVRDHLLVAPFPEENVDRVIAEIGIEPIVFGSDFPHGEGLAFPRQYASAQLKNLSAADVRYIMRDNLAGFLGLEG